jgi:cleavage and polyadenylation specificity factor subunit 2
LILLSFGDLEHVGSLPLIIGKLGLKVPIYCTLPTLSMGQQTLYEAHQCQPQDSHHFTNKTNLDGDSSASSSASSSSTVVGGGFTAFNLDHIDEAFKPMKLGSRNGIRTLKYNEQLVVKDFDLSIVPLNSGRVLGGCMWKLKWQTDEILYATDFNVMNEVTIPKAALDSVTSRPSLLITDATNWNRKLNKTAARWLQLRELVLKTIRLSGSVLLPSDAAGRSLELLHFLDRLWDELRLDGKGRECV